MNPLDKISAAASRLFQEADAVGNSQTGIRLREIAASIRGAVATIRRAAEVRTQGDRIRFNLLVGDERCD